MAHYCEPREEKICEEYYNKTVFRNSSGKFVVRFSLKESHFELGEFKQIAIKRMLFHDTKLNSNDPGKSIFHL